MRCVFIYIHEYFYCSGRRIAGTVVLLQYKYLYMYCELPLTLGVLQYYYFSNTVVPTGSY